MSNNKLIDYCKKWAEYMGNDYDYRWNSDDPFVNQLWRDKEKEIKQLKEQNKELKFMIDNGLGWEDMKPYDIHRG